jgi:hypothetical protein
MWAETDLFVLALAGRQLVPEGALVLAFCL